MKSRSSDGESKKNITLNFVFFSEWRTQEKQKISGLSLPGEGVSWETKQWLALNALIT
jgi:hypothetical protein